MFKAVLLAVAIAGVVTVLGAVGECENGGDLYQCTWRGLLGLLMIIIAGIAHVLCESIEGGEDK